MDQYQRRKIRIDIESGVLGDVLFSPEVAKTLREIADLMDSGRAGRFSREVYLGPRGTVAVVTANDVDGICIPYQEQDDRHRFACPAKGSSESQERYLLEQP